VKLRPQFNLRFRDAEQFVAIKEKALSSADRSVNEWILKTIEERMAKEKL
jgi:predicted HicB family RNase H-like nuclease